jgi:hypothetical protein
MATSRIRVTVPYDYSDAFNRLSDHENLNNIVDQVTTSKLIKESDSSSNINGLGAIRQITFKGDLLTEQVVAWFPPVELSDTDYNKTYDLEAGYDYKIIAGMRLIADHLGVIRIRPTGTRTSHISWDIHLKVPIWASGEIAAYFVCRTIEKEITESLIRNMT